MEKYPCIFKGSIDCPVKEAFKLSPESLVEYCKVCYLRPKEEEGKTVQEEEVIAFARTRQLMLRRSAECTVGESKNFPKCIICYETINLGQKAIRIVGNKVIHTDCI